MEEKFTPIDKEKIKDIFNKVFSQPMKVKRHLTLYSFDPRTILELNQMMKEEAEKYLNK